MKRYFYQVVMYDNFGGSRSWRFESKKDALSHARNYYGVYGGTNLCIKMVLRTFVEELFETDLSW